MDYIDKIFTTNVLYNIIMFIFSAAVIGLVVIVILLVNGELEKAELCECLGYDQYDIFTSTCMKKAYHDNGYTYDTLYSGLIDFDKAKVICENKKKNEAAN